ncbi:MAG: hypothetical protein WA625_14480 [Pseudolabrys sp.]
MKKVLRIIGTTLVVLVVAIVGLILILDPPPLKLRDETGFVLSVPAPRPSGPHDSLEAGIACDHKLQTYSSSMYGRPIITVFDWLSQRVNGKVAEPDYHLYGTKPNDTWAFKVDRATKTVCFQTPSNVKAGVSDPYCGPKITFENVDRIVAVEDRPYDWITAVLFNKKNFALTMTQINVLEQLGASMQYFQCH